MENVTEDTVFGAGKMEDFTWKQMLDFSTCTECGRCQSVCPAWTTGKPLSPKLLIMGLRDNMFASADRLLSGGSNADVATLVPTRSIRTSCGPAPRAVVVSRSGPVDIEHVDAIIDMRRYEVMMESRFPTEAALLLRNMENQGDPWGLGSSQRTKWLDALDFEVRDHRRTDPRGHRVPLLGWLCRLARRARSQTGGLHGAHAAPRGREFRHPRAARVLHWRPGASNG